MARREVTVVPKAAPEPAQVVSTPKDRDGSQTGRATLVLREMLLEGHFQPGERIKTRSAILHGGCCGYIGFHSGSCSCD